MIDFEEEIQRFKPSLDVEAVEDAIVKRRSYGYDGYYDGDDPGKRREKTVMEIEDKKQDRLPTAIITWVWRKQGYGIFPERPSA